jgi:hypothetical protein
MAYPENYSLKPLRDCRGKFSIFTPANRQVLLFENLPVLASEGEYFHALRDCREKFSIFTIREISQTLKPKP